jgi:hypothetical protein
MQCAEWDLPERGIVEEDRILSSPDKARQRPSYLRFGVDIPKPAKAWIGVCNPMTNPDSFDTPLPSSSLIQQGVLAVDGLCIRPMQWGELPELHEAMPLDLSDLACLADLKTVLARHGKLDRFAVQLAHRHFGVGEGEILVEQPDPQSRTQLVSVARHGDHPSSIPTTWLFDDSPALHLVDDVYCVCVKANGVDCDGHGKSPVPPEPVLRERRQEEIGNPTDKQAEIDRINRERPPPYEGPVAGHGKRDRVNDPGRGR